MLAGELNFEPVAVCDIWNKRRDEGADFVVQQADKLKVPIGGEQLAKARNTDELYSKKNIDAVIIATADFQHAYHCINGASRQKTSMSKPFANIMSDARAALKLVKGQRRLFQ
jgi:predicted dehydrogenase